MEPAVYRREHGVVKNALDADCAASQWSPPFIGGSTLSNLPTIAAEVAVAMEPAVYRREHWRTQVRVKLLASRSQWSPPFIGGSTRARRSSSRSCPPWRSQWSPPFIGGSTAVGEIELEVGGGSQWSPPFIGGSTRPIPGQRRGGKHVAMEPAVYRREHPQPTARSPSPRQRRNGARRL